MAETWPGSNNSSDNQSVQDRYSYPEDCVVMVHRYSASNGDVYYTHSIVGTGAPGSDYNNAPAGSEYIDLTTGYKYCATGTLGAAVTAWVSQV